MSNTFKATDRLLRRYVVGGEEERGVADGVEFPELGDEVSGVAESDPTVPPA